MKTTKTEVKVKDRQVQEQFTASGKVAGGKKTGVWKSCDEAGELSKTTTY